MKSFFEKFRDDSSRISIRRNENHVYPLHFHSNLEIFIIKKGCYNVTCNNQIYTVCDNSLFIFDSYDIHSYVSRLDDECEDAVVIIPYDYLSNFLSVKNGKKLANPLIISQALINKLYSIVAELETSESPYKTQALVDLLLSTLLESVELSNEKIESDNGVLRLILSHVQNNFKGSCTREDIASSLGYSKTYISKVFNLYMKCNISTYVNTLRAKYVKDNLNKGKTVLELIYEAGFSSQQTYYRFIKNSK